MSNITGESEDLRDSYKFGISNKHLRKLKSSTKWCVLVLLVVGVVLYFFPSFMSKKNDISEDTWIIRTNRLRENVKEISKLFPNQDRETWITFGAGIQRVEEVDEPSVFLILHNNEKSTCECIINRISRLVYNFLPGDSHVNPVRLEGSNLNRTFGEDEGKLIDLYSIQVTKRKVMIVLDLEQVSGKVASAFHYFCDTYNPLVRQAVYFFTMNTQGESISKERLTGTAERVAKSTWQHGLVDFKLDPLITRLTSNVIRIQHDDTANVNCEF